MFILETFTLFPATNMRAPPLSAHETLDIKVNPFNTTLSESTANAMFLNTALSLVILRGVVIEIRFTISENSPLNINSSKGTSSLNNPSSSK